MKKNKVYIIWIIFLAILIGFSIYNYTHPIPKTGRIISTGKVIGFNEELNYDENSEYTTTYTMELETKNNGNITIHLNKEDLDKYKAGNKLNYYEEKGEYLLTTERANDYNTNIVWIIISVVEALVIVYLVFKIIKKKNK